MVKLRIRNLSFTLTFLSYLILFIFIIVGSISNDDPNVIFKTLSEIIDENATNTSIYLIFITIYGVIKAPLQLLTLYDISQLFPNKKKSFFVSQTSQKNVLYIFSYIGFLFAVFQLVTMILLVFFPISKVYYTHLIIAAMIFLSSLIKSFLLFVRRIILFQDYKLLLGINIMYLLLLFGSIVWFYFQRYGLIEYLLVALILAENFILLFEFFDLVVLLRLEVDENRYIYTKLNNGNSINASDYDDYDNDDDGDSNSDINKIKLIF